MSEISKKNGSNENVFFLCASKIAKNTSSMPFFSIEISDSNGREKIIIIIIDHRCDLKYIWSTWNLSKISKKTFLTFFFYKYRHLLMALIWPYMGSIYKLNTEGSIYDLYGNPKIHSLMLYFTKKVKVRKIQPA